MMMRTFIRERGLVTQDVSFCRRCHGELGEQILANYRAARRFREGARFLEEADEALAMLAGIKG